MTEPRPTETVIGLQIRHKAPETPVTNGQMNINEYAQTLPARRPLERLTTNIRVSLP